MASLRHNPDPPRESIPEISFTDFDSIMPSPSRPMETFFTHSTPSFPLEQPAKIITGEIVAEELLTTSLPRKGVEPLPTKASMASYSKVQNSPPQIDGGKETGNPAESPPLSLPSQGVWALPPTPHPPTYFSLWKSGQKPLDVLFSPKNWPSLSKDTPSPHHHGQTPGVVQDNDNGNNITTRTASIPPAHEVEASFDTLESEEENKRFPWAAKMNPALRNLYRATSPTYLEDGTPKVMIPSHVLLQGLENQKEYVLGQFYRCSNPSGGLIHAVVNRIWGRKCKIFMRKLGESSYLFHIPDESTRSWVIQRGLWHVDDCLLFVAPWSPAATLSLPEISTVPVWVTLKNIPSQLYSISGISHIASGLGAPMLTNKPRLDPMLMGEAKIMVEIELDKPFPQRIAAADKKGTIYMVDVEYSWVPTKCGKCGQLGHKGSRCLQHNPLPQPKKVGEVLPLSAFGNQLSDPISVPTTEVPNVVVHVSVSNTEVIVFARGSNAEDAPATKHIPFSISETTKDSTIEAVSTCSVETYVETIISQDTEIAASSEVAFTITDLTEVAKVATSTSCISTSQEVSLPSRSSVLQTSPVFEVTAHITGSPLVDHDENAEMVMGSIEQEASVQDVEEASAQRNLRDRPVKPTQKLQEMEWISVHGRRGNKGRRGRGGRGNNDHH